MVPTDYRLEQVCARLIERLEGIRRAHAGDERRAVVAFQRLAREHVEAAIREYQGVALADRPQVQARLLRREVLNTFVPRYTRLAIAMNRAEDDNFGFGGWGEPRGRVILGLVAVMIALACARVIRVPALWLGLFAVVALPFASDLAGWMHQRRYRRRLEVLLDDLQQVQALAHPYLDKDELIADERDNVVHLRRPPEPEPGEE